jgi:hypothetical protein
MKLNVKYDRELTGLLAGFILPAVILLFIWLFSTGDSSLREYVIKLNSANIVTHIMSLSVFPNIVTFLLFNRFDMLRASRGVLAATIVWAVVVFGIKFFG